MLDMTEGGGEAKAGGGAPPVFVSYASQDAAVADTIVEALERRGVKCWIAPRDVVPGEFYADAIVGAINATRIVLVVLTGNAVGSPHVLREIERASAKRHPVVSFRIDTASLPAGLEYFLSASHWLDATSGIDAALPKLVEAVQRLVAPTSAVEPAHQAATAAPVAGLFPQPPVAAKPKQRLSRPVIALSAVLALGLAYFAVDKLWMLKHAAGERPVAALTPETSPAAPAISDKSVAVLPFLDMSEKKDQEYFSDGLSEELIDMLTKIPELRVPARTSSFYFKGKQATVHDIAKALGVANVLEGSVRKSGNTLRITAQLIRVDNGYHVWSETYDRKLHDIFKIQDDIASAVVKALKSSLLDGGSKHGPVTRNSAAYALYLQGRFYGYRQGVADTQKALDFLQQAVRLDPEFAAAWAELSRLCSNSTVVDFGLLKQQQARELALQAAERALALDPKLPEAHIALGKIRLWFDWDWAAADAEMTQARSLDPANADALNWGGLVAQTLGRLDEARRLSQQAIAQDPLNAYYHASIAETYWYLGRMAEAKVAYRKALDLNPALPGVHADFAVLRLLEGEDPAAALAEIGRELDPSSREWSLAFAYHVLGRTLDANAALAEMEQKHAGDQAYGIAELHAYRGEVDQAFAWLERAYRQRDAGLTDIKGDPNLKNLRGDPRYKAFLRKMNLPE
jgi:TolB-like protein/Tfp pilus assembly protein PilF